MACEKHKDVPTTVQTTAGPRCAWCDVSELRKKLDRANERINELEMENAQLQMDQPMMKRLERAAGLAVIK